MRIPSRACAVGDYIFPLDFGYLHRPLHQEDRDSRLVRQSYSDDTQYGIRP